MYLMSKKSMFLCLKVIMFLCNVDMAQFKD